MTAFGGLPVNMVAAATGQTVKPQGWTFGPGSAPLVRNPQTFAATITPDLALGNWLTIVATSNIAFAVQDPVINGLAVSASNPLPLGFQLVITLLNNSGGALGAFTMPGALWRGASGYAAPGNGLQISSNWAVLSATQILGVTNWSTAIAF